MPATYLLPLALGGASHADPFIIAWALAHQPRVRKVTGAITLVATDAPSSEQTFTRSEVTAMGVGAHSVRDFTQFGGATSDKLR